MTTADYVVVGTGLTGATVARLLEDQGREVMLIERRPAVGGNVRDFLHPSGIRVHAYGPHYFRCSSRRIWDFVNRFSPFRPYRAKIQSYAGGRYHPWPLQSDRLGEFPGWESQAPAGDPRNFEEACLQQMPRALYEQFIRGYTSRQWGMDPRELEPQLARRIRTNRAGVGELTPTQRFQGLPILGYAAMMEGMLAGIPCECGVDYLQQRDAFRARRALIYTGPLDEFFGCDEGRLGYRGQTREHRYLPDRDLCQPCVQVNHPQAKPHEPLRSIEWKHLMPQEDRDRSKGTVVTSEHPFTPVNSDQYEYPMPVAQHRALARRYAARAATIGRLVACGRLGEYRYFDMDQAIGRAMTLAERVLSRNERTAAASPPVR